MRENITTIETNIERNWLKTVLRRKLKRSKTLTSETSQIAT